MFRFDFFRQGVSVEPMGSSPFFPGPAPAGQPVSDVDFGWNGFNFDVPGTWKSGVYVAVIVEWDGTGLPPPVVQPTSLFAPDGQLLFVVKSTTPGRNTILYKVPIFTYHGYNATGGASFYQGGVPSVPPDPPGIKLTLMRPGSGTGGVLQFPEPDCYDSSLHPATFVYWDAPFIAWLEERYSVDYCTDLDIHADAALLGNYRLLLSVGHDEYWSEPLRSHIEEFIASGGNVAFFSGNVCYWRVHIVDGYTSMICSKSPPTDLWWSGVPAVPENSVTGVSWRNGGGWYVCDPPRPQIGYTVQFTGHWVFEGTGLSEGQVIGSTVVPPVIGYECDGAQFQYDGANHAVPTTKDQTPDSFIVLGVGVLGSGWAFDPREPGAVGPRAATMGVYANNGTAFTAATTEWPRVAVKGQDAAVTKITENVVDVLSELVTVDITGITGRTVHGPVTSWQTPGGSFAVEYLGGVDASGDVVVFSFSQQAGWQAADVSVVSGRTLAPGAPLTSWQVPDGPSTGEHLGGVDAGGNVIVFARSPEVNWQAVNVSAVTAPSFTAGAPLTSFQVPNTSGVPGGPSVTEFLGGVDIGGHVIVFSWTPEVGWLAVDVSVITGRTLAPGTPLTSWQVPDGVAVVAYLAGVDPSGNVIVFWSRNAEAGWQAADVAFSGRTFVPGVPLTSWQVPDGRSAVGRFSAVDTDGNVVVFSSSSPQTGWLAVDASAASGQSLVGGVTSWQVGRPGLRTPLVVEKLAGVSPGGDVQVLARSPAHDWSSFNVSRHTGTSFTTAPASWKVPYGPYVIERLAAPTPSGSLALIAWRTPN